VSGPAWTECTRHVWGADRRQASAHSVHRVGAREAGLGVQAGRQKCPPQRHP
jgi:hypothetical protein